MFREACKKLQPCILPVVTSIRTVNGDCASGLGTAVVVNDEGWVVTAAHILHQFAVLTAAEAQTRALQTQIDAVQNDPCAKRQRSPAKTQCAWKPKPTDITNWSVWLGIDGISFAPGLALDIVDLGIARLKISQAN